MDRLRTVFGALSVCLLLGFILLHNVSISDSNSCALQCMKTYNVSGACYHLSISERACEVAFDKKTLLLQERVCPSIESEVLSWHERILGAKVFGISNTCCCAIEK